jgi:hypothetical protein
MKKDKGAIRMETVLIVLCIIGVFAAALIYAAKSNKKRVALMQDFASSRGWSFSAADTEGLATKLDALSPDLQFHIFNVMAIESGPRTMRLFDYQYHFREHRRSDYPGTGCIVESSRFRNAGLGQDIVEIVDRTRLDTALAGDQVDMGNSGFSQNFMVISKNRIAAKNAITPALQSVLVRHHEAPLYNSVTIRMSATGAVVLNRSLDPDPTQWADLVELSRELEASLP